MNMLDDVPVVITFYNRPWALKALIESLRVWKPKILFLASDGASIPEHATAVAECRRVAESIDWPCDVTRMYRDENVGMTRNGVEAADAALVASEGIIMLEDDCIPRPGFFAFMQACHDAFQDEPKVGVYSAYNPVGYSPFLRSDIFLVRQGNYWGHFIKATHWREFRSIETRGMTVFECFGLAAARPGFLSKLFFFKIYFSHRKLPFPDAFRDLLFWKKGYLYAMPRGSLVDNIGVGDSATHTKELPKKLKLAKKDSILFETPPGLSRPVRSVSVIYGWLVLMAAFSKATALFRRLRRA